MSRAGVVRLAPLDLATWASEDDAPPTYSPFNTRFADSLVALEYEAVELHADDAVVELDVDATSISKDRSRLVPNRPGPRSGRVRVTLDRPGEAPMVYTMAGLYSSRQPGHALALRAIVATLQGLRDLDRWGVVRGRQYTGMLALPPAVAMPGAGAGAAAGGGPRRDMTWARAELAELTGLATDTPLGDLLRAARFHARDGEARERLDAVRAFVSGEEATQASKDYEAFLRGRRELESGGGEHA